MKQTAGFKKLALTFYAVTVLGSALSAVAAFLMVQTNFKFLLLLAIALSARTLACSLFSCFAEKLIDAIGIKRGFLLSQVFGVVALVVLAMGFQYHCFAIVLLGIMLTGLPGVFVAILLTVSIKLTTHNDGSFRSFSAKRGLIRNVFALIGAFLAPVLLLVTTLNMIFVIDGLTFFVGLLLMLWMPVLQTHDQHESEDAELTVRLLKRQGVKLYVLQTTAALLMAGLVPLLAGGLHLALTAAIPSLLKQWLWVVEDIMMILGSIIYLRYTDKLGVWGLNFLMVVNSIWLLILLNGSVGYLIIPVVALISLSVGLAMQKYRDDLVLSAGDNHRLVKKYSAFAQLQQNLIMFVSPIILALLLEYVSKTGFVVVCCCLQLLLFCWFSFCSRGRA